MSSNQKGASEIVKVLAVETNHAGRLHGWKVWNRPETLSVKTKRDWSSIHSEVKEAESMKSHSGGVVSKMEQNKEGKNSCCSLLPFDYIYIYIYALWKQKIVECMYDWNGMCVFAEGKLWMLEWLIPCPRMDMNELMCLLGRHEKYESLLNETWTIMPIGQLTDWF